MNPHFNEDFDSQTEPNSSIQAHLQDALEQVDEKDGFLNPEDSPFREEPLMFTVTENDIRYHRNGGTDWKVNGRSVLDSWYQFQSQVATELSNGVSLSTHMEQILAVSSSTIC
jgi:hypothetical protein